MLKFVKFIVATLGAILIGGLGSGVWEKILSPLFILILNSISKLLSFISTSYEDSIYLKAANVSDQGQAGTTLIFLVLLMTFAWVYQALSTKLENRFVSGFYSGLAVYFRGWFGIVFSGSSFVFLIITFSTSSTAYDIRKNSIDNMAIIRPYVGEQTYYMLYSQYLQVQGKDDFELFYHQLVSHADKYKISLKRIRE
ncbi:hypothetical protein HJ091_22785 [Vibrio parahaemolyticus]|nr:hypothetical protein [Vibrio parahaemolyticus]MBE4191526.1 hypothetical protein [Vibrio parahaemolyticus]